jgi:glucose-1-phosphate adenylyltransferase
VEEGAHVKDSVIMHDTVIKEGASVNRCIIDKRSIIGEHAVIGIGNREIPNSDFPKQLYSGLTIIGKWANVPAKGRIGTNCIIYPAATEGDFYSLSIPDGSTIRTYDER